MGSQPWAHGRCSTLPTPGQYGREFAARQDIIHQSIGENRLQSPATTYCVLQAFEELNCRCAVFRPIAHGGGRARHIAVFQALQIQMCCAWRAQARSKGRD